ncbi:uncharacterized protein DUF3750 [Phyllobacterium brassicacearum]|nr:uncharacterized protein DUF3750 [Phyllobacterium brassicacearum]
MIKLFARLALLILVVFIVPSLAAAGWWMTQHHANNWRDANWSSSNVLPAKPTADDAAIYVLAARTGGLKGALSLHSWLVLKRPGTTHYDRYDVVGWGTPVRKNAYDADGRWYSNTPSIVHEIHGTEAATLISKIETAILKYPYAKPGNYVIWPGPNSNSFVAHILRSVPEIGVVLPANAVGRDFPTDGKLFAIDDDWRNVHATLFGYTGFAVGARSGFEINFMGLVAGFDILNPGLKVPGFGRIDL